MRIKTLVWALCALLYGSGALAAGAGQIFFGGGLGSGDANDTFFDGGAAIAVDDDDLWLKLMLGVEINDWLTFHGGYIDFGEYDSAALLANGNLVTGRTEVDGFYGGVNVKYTFASGKMFIYGALGAMAWDTEFSGSFFEGEDDGAEPYYGVGIGRKVNDSFTVTGEFIRYQLDNIDIDAFGVNVFWYPGFINH